MVVGAPVAPNAYIGGALLPPRLGELEPFYMAHRRSHKTLLRLRPRAECSQTGPKMGADRRCHTRGTGDAVSSSPGATT
jgi:hypothetical protein